MSARPSAEPDRTPDERSFPGGTRGPLAVGGLGGSGTRAVARILQRAGFYLGADLNHALDNLWFALLFQRPGWYRRSSGEERRALVRLFADAMRGRLPASSPRLLRVLRPALETTVRGLDHKGFGRGTWAWHRVRYLVRYGWTSPEPLQWGWKEPNTHIYLPELADTLGPGFRYLHVVRHGLDMAYSSNLAQLFNWGPLFGITIPDDPDPALVARLQLRFWARANRTAVDSGQRLLGRRFHLLSFDDLCARPRKTVLGLLRWLDRRLVDGEVEELASLIRPPVSRGRYRRHSLEPFSDTDLDYVRELGFSIS